MTEVKVCKEVTFDCAHMLSGHGGLCKNLHGHTYKVQIIVEGPQHTMGSSSGMVIDFKHLKQAITDVIMDKFDHAVIFSSEGSRGSAENALYEWAKTFGVRHYVMPSRTTAENMAIHFQHNIQAYLEGQEKVNSCKVSVRVFETPTSYAEVDYEDCRNL